MSHVRKIAGLFFIALATGCASHQIPRNIEDAASGEAYQFSYRAPDQTDRSGFAESAQCRGSGNGGEAIQAGNDASASAPTSSRGPEVLSTGDLVEIFVEQDETFTGSYVIGMDGRLRLPFVQPVQAAGRRTAQVEKAIASALVNDQLYDNVPRVSVLLTDYAEAEIFVSGAVFEPRQTLIGGSNADSRDPARQAALGAATLSRTLSAALRNAGGIRPDADLANVQLVRGGQRERFDIRGAIQGNAFPDPVLISGDRIEVPSRGCFQDALMVPSSVSPPGVKVFMSNLSETALSNAQAAVPDAREMRYGTRYLQAVFGLNCVGGSKLTNANRRVVLFSRNPLTGESIVIDRSIEELMRRADRDDFNPYILPEDALACYDSTVVSLKNLAAALRIATAAVIIAD